MKLRADIATGETTLDRTDLTLAGALPLVLARRYRSGAAASIFGLGWEHGLDRSLRVEADRVIYREPSGKETVFAPIGIGMEARHTGGLTLQHHADVWVVFASPLIQEVFRKSRNAASLPLERIVDPNGNRIKLGYDGGRLAAITGPREQQIRFIYAGGVVRQIVVVGADNRASVVRTFRYGAGATLIAETDAVGLGAEYAYQGGLLVRAGATGGTVWLAQYSADRRCTALWRSDGTAVYHIAYDALRQTTRSVALDGRQVVYRHALGIAGPVVLERIDTASRNSTYQYDEAQHLIGYTDAKGVNVTFQRLDTEAQEYFQIDCGRRFALATLGSERLLQTVGNGAEENYTFGYDERYNIISLTTPLEDVWKFEREQKGRVSAIVSPVGRRLTLHREGTSLTVGDEDGPRLRITTDLFGRIVGRIDRAGREQRFRYDTEGRLIAVEVGDEYSVVWEYDRGGQLVRVADSERNEVRRTYDGAGRVLSVETGQQAMRFVYDLAGRISAAAGAEGEVHFAYDEQDFLTGAKGPHRTIVFSYDEEGVVVTTEDQRLVCTSEGEPLEEHSHDGSMRRFSYESSGELYLYEEKGEEETSSIIRYDAEGRIAELRKKEDSAVFGYDADGLLTAIDPGTQPIHLGYDARLRPATLQVGEAAYRFTFDDANRLTAFGGEGAKCSFRYDMLGRCQAFREGTEAEVTTKAGAVERRQVAEDLAFLVAPQGVVLIASVGKLTIPLWGHSEMRLPSLSLGIRTARALVRGSQASVISVSEEPGPPVGRWLTLTNGEGIETGIPSAATLGVPWATLDLFALARDRYDPSFTRRTPGMLAQNQPVGRHALDDALTGSHRRGILQAPVWAERAHGMYLSAPPTPGPGSISSDLAVRLYHMLTRP